MAPIPLFKVGALVLRTLAKPVAARLMVDAKNHPTVAKICVVFGQFGHQLTSRINIIASGYRIVGVAPLPQEEALNSGVSIVSEILVFFVAGSILVYEYQVSEASNAAKAAAAAKEKNDAKQQLEDRLSAIDTQLLVLADRLQTLEKAQAQQEANATSGAIPYGWIFGIQRGSQGSNGANGRNNSSSNNSDAGVAALGGMLSKMGRATENLPSMLEEGDIIEDSSVSSGGGSGSAEAVVVTDEQAGGAQAVSAGAGGSAGKTWWEWATWR